VAFADMVVCAARTAHQTLCFRPTRRDYWLELGNHLEADPELDQIEDKYRVAPGRSRSSLGNNASLKNWAACVDIAEVKQK
jgi:hypothetical protein